MFTPRKKWIVGAAALLLLVLVGTALAQPEQIAKRRSWFDLVFRAGGTVGWVLIALSVVGTALSIEHIVNLRKEKLAPLPLVEELEGLINEEKYDDAIAVCDAEGGYLSNLVGSALRMRHAGYEEMIAGLEQAAAEESFKLNAKVAYLSLIGNVAPLLGLLGTVTGMISAFQVIEAMKAPSPAHLANGVYEALVTTTIGLVLAVIFLSIYFVFKNRATKLSLSVNLLAVDLLKHLAGEGAR